MLEKLCFSIYFKLFKPIGWLAGWGGWRFHLKEPLRFFLTPASKLKGYKTVGFDYLILLSIS